MEGKAKPAINGPSLKPRLGSPYPVPFDGACAGLEKIRMADFFGLTQFGVNLLRMPPGKWSSQRHWHSREDELIYVVEGEVTLVTGAGEQLLSPGMVVGFKTGVPDGHHLVNRSDRDALVLEVGTRDALDECDYPDIDMLVRIVEGKDRFVHKDGTPY